MTKVASDRRIFHDPVLLADARKGRAAWLRAAIADLPQCGGPDYIANHAAHVAAMQKLADRLHDLPDAPRIKIEWNGASISMLGVRSTSTSGMHGALMNWIRRVE